MVSVLSFGYFYSTFIFVWNWARYICHWRRDCRLEIDMDRKERLKNFQKSVLMGSNFLWTTESDKESKQQFFFQHQSLFPLHPTIFSKYQPLISSSSSSCLFFFFTETTIQKTQNHSGFAIRNVNTFGLLTHNVLDYHFVIKQIVNL